MKLFTSLFRSVVALTMVATVFLGTSFGAEIKPYKVALVIGDQWEDPMSCLVTPRSGELWSLVIMFKSWGIPFDIIRLDQEFMDINRFIGPDGKPEVGCIIWDADQTAKLQPQRYQVLREAVNEHGISLIALSDRIKEPIIQELLGIEYVGSGRTSDDLNHSGEHFITKGLKDPLDHTDKPGANKKSVQVKLVDAKSIVKQGQYPQATVRQLPSGARAVWIGGDIGRLFSYQECRTLLRRAITFSIGYSLFKTWENKATMKMDDPGSAQNSWLKTWHYPTLTEQQIDEHLIKPLKKHNAILMVMVCPGFVNDELKRVEPSFQRKFIDGFGTLQDYPSTKRGLIKGMKAGVIEIQFHGLTHMQPDLWSPPGPWYGSALDQERAKGGWYREFGDTRRNKEIPAAEAFWRMKTGIRWMEHQFGITPLVFIAGGGGVSTSYPNNTSRLAAQAGFGWLSTVNRLLRGYLGPNMAVRGWDFDGTMESPLRVSVPPDGHDKGIAEHPEQFLRVFEEHPNVEWMGLNEYVGYIHAKLSGRGGKNLALQVSYDPHYCRYFKDHASQWNLLLSDWLAKDLGRSTISVDDKTVIEDADLSKQLKVRIPAGVGVHNVQIK